MSADRLAEIAARIHGTTDGPWCDSFDDGEAAVVDPSGWVLADLSDGRRQIDGESEADVTFIARARTDVPDLVAAIQRVRAEHWLDIPTGWCGQCVNEHGGEEAWPCPTYRATMLPGEAP